MSTRTIVEINHDRLGEIERLDKGQLLELIRQITDTSVPRRNSMLFGVRTLVVRHHSTSLAILVNGLPVHSEERSASS